MGKQSKPNQTKQKTPVKSSIVITLCGRKGTTTTKDYVEMLKTHLVLLKENRGTIAGCGRLEIYSITMRNKVAERRVSAAYELVQVIIG